jgi:hypothetical protein
MSIQLVSYLKGIYPKFKGLSIVENNRKKKKSKKNEYMIRDGYLTMNIKFQKDGVNCIICKDKKNCSLKKCHHVYFILIEHLKLNINQLSLLWQENNWDLLLGNEIPNQDYDDIECGICLDEIKQYGKVKFNNIYQCLECGSFSHTKCLSRINKDHCLFCYTPNNPTL